MNDQQHDEQVTVAELREVVRQFVDERDWRQFHSPKNLSMAMAIEVAELMEHFQWITSEESRDYPQHQPARQAIQEELADVFCYVLALANAMNIDLSSALEDKMITNRQKYPIEQYRGKF